MIHQVWLCCCGLWSLLGAQCADLPWRWKVPWQGSSCSWLQVIFIIEFVICCWCCCCGCCCDHFRKCQQSVYIAGWILLSESPLLIIVTIDNQHHLNHRHDHHSPFTITATITIIINIRDATEFAGKRLLLVGSSYSAEDIALQCLKWKSAWSWRWPWWSWRRPWWSWWSWLWRCDAFDMCLSEGEIKFWGEMGTFENLDHMGQSTYENQFDNLN